ncbi:MAG: sulfotransferase, partial [Phycisphaerales bacterium]|nr:sulfotransferase [Phycisphaerales bacterium]
MARLNAGDELRRAGKLHTAGKYRQAERLYRSVLAGNPGDTTILRLLGMLERDRGRPDDALGWFRKARASADTAKLAAEEGLTLQTMGHFREAEDTLRSALADYPDDLMLSMMLARVLMSMAQAAAAASLLEPLAYAHDRDADLMLLMAAAANASGVLPVPTRYASAVTSLLPQDARGHAMLGSAHRLNGDLDSALAAFDKASAIDPSSTEAIAGKAHVLESMGRSDDAWSMLENSTATASPLVTLATVRVARRLNKHDVAAAAIDTALAAPRLSPYHRSHLLMQQGLVLEEMSRYDDAWAAWTEGNALHAGQFDMGAHRNLVQTIIDTEIPTLEGSNSSQPVFIVGMFRSGTTLMEQVLGAHENIDTAGEVDAMLRLVHAHPYPACLEQPPNGAAQEYLAALRSDAPRVTDKMPANYLHVGLIHALFPHATILHMTRDARDTCVSCYANAFAASQAYTADLEELAEVYGLYSDLMAHWNTALPNRMYPVSYEDLVTNPEPTVRGVLDAMGVAWEPACLNFHAVRRIPITPSADQVR